jgi:septal ring factor EnvC (AmiA/AmiB activator)
MGKREELQARLLAVGARIMDVRMQMTTLEARLNALETEQHDINHEIISLDIEESK